MHPFLLCSPVHTNLTLALRGEKTTFGHLPPPTPPTNSFQKGMCCPCFSVLLYVPCPAILTPHGFPPSLFFTENRLLFSSFLLPEQKEKAGGDVDSLLRLQQPDRGCLASRWSLDRSLCGSWQVGGNCFQTLWFSRFWLWNSLYSVPRLRHSATLCVPLELNWVSDGDEWKRKEEKDDKFKKRQWWWVLLAIEEVKQGSVRLETWEKTKE